jgi:hypothetical protein
VATPPAKLHQYPGYLLVAPIKNFAHAGQFLGKPGPEIIEQSGDPVWEHPLGELIPVPLEHRSREKVAMDFHTASLEGKPVLVWWEGYITPAGYGNGVWEIVNDHYQPVASIHAPTGFTLDFHEIQLTSRATAYIVADKTVKVSLTCCGGASNGEIIDSDVFEVSVKTGRVLWGWDPLNHIPLRASYTTPPHGAPWDPYHANSISFSPTGDIIVSMRNTWAAYWVNRVAAKNNGAVYATLGGRNSSFKLGPGATFAWQHDVLQQPNGTVSIFDDEATPAVGKQSRAIVLAVSFTAHTASLVHEYVLPTAAYTGSQGNTQILPNGNVLVGWGQLPYVSEYDAEGNLLYLGQLPGPDESYRAFRSSWVGLPLTRPALAVQGAGTGVVAYVSWNGATQVADWQLLAGTSPTELEASGEPVPRTGFETAIPATERTNFYAVQGVSASGHVLGTSFAVRLKATGLTVTPPALPLAPAR